MMRLGKLGARGPPLGASTTPPARLEIFSFSSRGEISTRNKTLELFMVKLASSNTRSEQTLLYHIMTAVSAPANHLTSIDWTGCGDEICHGSDKMIVRGNSQTRQSLTQ